jgi:hypothetical protein
MEPNFKCNSWLVGKPDKFVPVPTWTVTGVNKDLVVSVKEEALFVEGKSAEICGTGESPRSPFAHMAYKAVYGLPDSQVFVARRPWLSRVSVISPDLRDCYLFSRWRQLIRNGPQPLLNIGQFFQVQLRQPSIH